MKNKTRIRFNIPEFNLSLLSYVIIVKTNENLVHNEIKNKHKINWKWHEIDMKFFYSKSKHEIQLQMHEILAIRIGGKTIHISSNLNYPYKQ